MPDKKPRPRSGAAKPQDGDLVMTVTQEFYLRHNIAQSDEALSLATGLAVEDVRRFRETLPPPKKEDGTAYLFHRHNQEGQKVEGFVAMTPQGSMFTDDASKKGFITDVDINKAVAAQNYELAAELKKKKDAQLYEPKLAYEARNADKFAKTRPDH